MRLNDGRSGFDTSNYTTSVAASRTAWAAKTAHAFWTCGPVSWACGSPTRCLRTSSACRKWHGRTVCRDYPSAIRSRAVGASTRPRAVDGSYMPCFLAGQLARQQTMAACRSGVPFHAVSHQQGHVAAALWSAGRMELMDVPHLAWHLSGGTTELLLITPEGKNVRAEKLGGTSDISAGQLIDRTGKLLGLAVSGGQGARRAEPGGGCGGGFPCEGEWADVLVLRGCKIRWKAIMPPGMARRRRRGMRCGR